MPSSASAGSATSPSSFLLNRFKRYPYKPVISALGTRVVLAMAVPPVDVVDVVDAIAGVDMKTPPAPPDVTPPG